MGWSGLNVSAWLVWVLRGAWPAKPVGMAQPARPRRWAQTPPEPGPVAQRRMRAHAVVMPPPALDHNFGLLECVEDLAIQQLVRFCQVSRQPVSPELG